MWTLNRAYIGDVWRDETPLWSNKAESCSLPLYHSGGARGGPTGACTPAVNPCALAVPRQASRRHFTVPCPFCTSAEANSLTLTAPEGGIFKANFQQISGVTTPDPLYGKGLPHPAPTPSASTPNPDHHAPSIGSYGAPLVTQQEQTPGAATLNQTTQVHNRQIQRQTDRWTEW